MHQQSYSNYPPQIDVLMQAKQQSTAQAASMQGVDAEPPAPRQLEALISRAFVLRDDLRKSNDRIENAIARAVGAEIGINGNCDPKMPHPFGSIPILSLLLDEIRSDVEWAHELAGRLERLA